MLEFVLVEVKKSLSDFEALRPKFRHSNES
jgi:hypothetical protein